MEPGDRATPPADGPGHRLPRPPSDRYAAGRAGGRGDGGAAGPVRSALAAPLALALVVSALGAGALLVVGTILASTAGLLFTAGVTGAAIGLVLARATAPRGNARPATRRAVGWLAVALSIGAVAVAALATWLVARGEGGSLGLLDYLLTTFGPFIPGEAVVAAIAAAWGANAGPVQA